MLSVQKTLSIPALLAHLRVPLYRNGYVLMLSGLLSAALGMLYWLLAARTYPAATLGLNSAAISAMMLISGLAQLSLNSALLRFIPQTGPKTAQFVLAAYGISVGLGLLGGVLFVVGIDLWMPALRIFLGGAIARSSFVLSVMIWSVFALQDSVLAGLRQPTWVLIENASVAVGKVLLLLGFALFFPAYGVFAAWMIPAALSLAPINHLIFKRLLPPQHQSSPALVTPVTPQGITRFVLGNYAGTLAYLAYTTVLPLLVTSQAGAQANAFFYIPWMIAVALQLITTNLTTSLTVEAAHDERQVALFCYQILRQGLRLLVPLVFVVLVAAPVILHFFGRAYAEEGTALLRLLALAALPNLLGMLYVSLARIQKQAAGVMLAQGLLALLLVGLSYWLLPIYGITGVGWAALISQSAVALVALSSQLRPLLIQGYHVHQKGI